MRYLHGVVERVATEAPKRGWRVSVPIVQDVAARLHESASTYNEDSMKLHERVRRVHNRLKGLDVGGCYMHSTCWMGASGGHAIMTVFLRESEEHFAVVVVNTGQGLGHHASAEIEWPKVGLAGNKAKCAMRLDGIPRDRVIDPAAIWCLMRNGSKAHDRNGPHLYYQLYLPYICDGDPSRFAARSHETNDSAKSGDWITPQRAGTCYYRSSLAALRFYARLRGMSKEECKRFTLYIRACYMLMVKEDL